MARPKKKDSKAISARIDVNIAEKLDKFCEESGMSKTTIMERSIIAFIDDYHDKQQKLQELK